MATYDDPYNIADYKPFYIQVGGVDSSPIDLRETYHLVCRANPYPLLPNPKTPFKNEWLDEDGDEEYTAEMYYEAFEFEVGFVIKAKATGSQSADAVIRSYINSFFDHIRSAVFCTWDEYTGLGFRGARYAGFKEDSYKARDDWARAQFTVTFKVNDPTTRVSLDSDADYIVTEEAYVCSSSVDSSNKVVSMATIPTDGLQASIKFTNGNSATSPYLKYSGTADSYAISGLPTSWTDAMRASYHLLEYSSSASAFIYKGIV